MKRVHKIEVDCASCAAKMQDAACKVKGVVSAVVNFMTLKMTVEFEEGACPDDVMKDVLKACRKIEPDCNIYF